MSEEPAAKMGCPVCGVGDCRVVDSRLTVHGEIRRRRKCGNSHRFTTYETILADHVQDDPMLIALDELDRVFSDSIRHLRRTRMEARGL